MISTEKIIKEIAKCKINFFTGVPDSVLKNITNNFSSNLNKHIIAVNEGAAVSLAIGYHLATKKMGCVYFQNSGLSNAINPLSSLADKNIYSIPMLLLIGWRGSPGSKDEAQHLLKGKITRDLLKLLKIKYIVLNSNIDLKKIKGIVTYAKKNNRVVACLIKKNSMSQNKIYNLKDNVKIKKKIIRENFIRDITKILPNNCKIISTTGYTSRELFQIRNQKIKNKIMDFYMVGGMGHASMVSLGYSIKNTKTTICLDGDGSVLMHLGSLRTCGLIGKKNFKHILLNNNCHESVGGQITNAFDINFKQLTKSIGYKNYFKLSEQKNSKKTIKKFLKSKGPSFLEVYLENKSMYNLKRPKKFLEIKKQFMKK